MTKDDTPPRPDKPDLAVIGGGPAGLMAAEIAASRGLSVIVTEAKPSLGRKLLMAGKSGLNLTNDTCADRLPAAYGAAADWLAPMLTALGPAQIVDWAHGLGQPVFTGTTGRVFPVAMKASPLLRAWLARLGALRVQTRTGWRWTGWAKSGVRFDTPDGPRVITPRATVFAMGGGSWARLGSDGGWMPIFAATGVPVVPFAPANAGLRRDWSHHMSRWIGTPVKPVRLTCGPEVSRGEIVLSAQGIEGGGIYPLYRALAAGHALHIDLLPDQEPDEIAARLARARGSDSLSNRLRKALRLPPVKLALLRELGHPLPTQPEALAAMIKALPVAHDGFAALDRAISTRGGVSRAAVDDRLMLTVHPGQFVAGEMMDWDAPTGGYLLTGCLATGGWAGHAAADWVHAQRAAAR